MMKGKITHIDERGAARMVDVGKKQPAARAAVAEAVVTVPRKLFDMIVTGDLPKGNVFAAARIAAIQAAKRTAELIPLCHPVPLTHVKVEFEHVEEPPSLVIRVEVRARWVTGVEMEALTAAAVAALTIYDMVKSVDRNIRIGSIRLVSKSGGRSGSWSSKDA